MARYFGSFDELKSIFRARGLDGVWVEKAGGLKCFTTRERAVMNWWEGSKKGTVNFQGPDPYRGRLEAAATEAIEGGAGARAAPANPKVFVVYGHEKDARDQLDAMLRRWGLEPLITDQLPSKGQTVIEKLEDYSDDVGFAVVLATPDDEGHRRDRPEERLYRSRQNVVLELGMMLSHLGRSKVAILMREQEKMERPSDIHGLIYIPFKDDLQKEAGPLLAKEMTALGYRIDVAKL
ncbi:MAG: TIR domain-containing protein [Pseudomonadota bacterium]